MVAPTRALVTRIEPALPEPLFRRSGGPAVHPVRGSVLFLNRVKGGLLAVTEQPPNPENPAQAPNLIDFELVAAPGGDHQLLGPPPD